MKLPLAGAQSADVRDKLIEWEDRVTGAIKKAYPELPESDLRFKSRVPLDLLPWEQRRKFMDEYYSTIGLGRALEFANGGSPAAGMKGDVAAMDVAQRMETSGNFSWLKRPGQKDAFGRFAIDGDDFVSHLLGSLNIQYRTPYGGSGVWPQFFGVGTKSVPTVSKVDRGIAMRQKMASGGSLLKPGNKYTIFDIETGGLDYGQIRSVDFLHGQVMPGMDMSGGAAHTANLRSSQFARGMYAVDGSADAVPTEEFMLRKFGIDYRTMKFGDGEDLLAKVEPLLRSFKDSDYIIGHNITGFDLDQVFTAVSGTSRYKNRPDFRKEIDDLFDSVQGKLVDTLEMAKVHPALKGIETAAEFARMGKASTHGVDNIVLQTNLLNLHPELRDLIMNRGLHDSAVDIQVNARLAQAMMNGTISTQNIDSILQDAPLRRVVSQGGALTPLTKITDQSMISDKVMETLIKHGDVRSLDPLTKLDAHLSLASAGDKNAIKEAMAIIRGGAHAEFGINSVQQGILSTRNLGRMASVGGRYPDKAASFHNIGMFDRLTGRNIPYQGSLKKRFGMMRRTNNAIPSVAQYEEFQKKLYNAGLPYAGLSFEERAFGSAIAELTSELAPTVRAATAARLGSESLIGHMKMWDPTMVDYASKKPTVPIQLLQSAGEAFGGIKSNAELAASKDPTMLRLSHYMYGDSAREVSLNFDFADEDARNKFTQYLSGLKGGSDEDIARALGYDVTGPDSFSMNAVRRFKGEVEGAGGVEDLIEALMDEERMKYGVQVGHIGPGRIADRLFDVINNVLGGKMRDSEAMDFAVPLVDTEVNKASKNGFRGTIRHGAPVEMTAVDEAAGRVFQSESRQAVGYLDDTIAKGIVDNQTLNSIAKLIKMSGNQSQVNHIIKIGETYDNVVRPNFKKLAIGAVVGAVGYMAYRKDKEAKKYEATLAPMPYESTDNNYLLNYNVQQRLLSGEGSYSRNLDPLATAPLVSNMRNYAIGHTSTSWDKNSAIYGGVI